VWLYGEDLDGGLARTEPIGNREIGISDVKRFGRTHVCETPNPDKG
jgi:hypothetical protein